MSDLMMKKPTNCLHSIVLSVKSDEVEHTKLIILRSSRKNCTDSLLQYQWWVTKFYPGHIYWLSKSTKTRFIRGKYQPTIFFIFKNWYQEFWHFNMCIMLEKFFDLLCQTAVFRLSKKETLEVSEISSTRVLNCLVFLKVI